MATHRILQKVEPGKLKMELTDKKGANTGEISFILQASGGRFAQSSGSGSGTTSQHGTGHGTGAGVGAGAGAGILVFKYLLGFAPCYYWATSVSADMLLHLQELALAGELALVQEVRRPETCRMTPQQPLVHAPVPQVPLVLAQALEVSLRVFVD